MLESQALVSSIKKSGQGRKLQRAANKGGIKIIKVAQKGLILLPLGLAFSSASKFQWKLSGGSVLFDLGCRSWHLSFLLYSSPHYSLRASFGESPRLIVCLGKGFA